MTAATDEEVVGYQRSPSDVIRLIAYGGLTIVLVVLTRWATGTLNGFQRDLIGLVNDVDPAVAEVAGLMTPVPGGVGPMTIACLLENAVACARLQRSSIP